MKFNFLIFFFLLFFGCAVSSNEFLFNNEISKTIPNDLAIYYLSKNNIDANSYGIILNSGFFMKKLRFKYGDLQTHVIRGLTHKYELKISSISVSNTFHVVFSNDMDNIRRLLECLASLGVVVS